MQNKDCSFLGFLARGVTTTHPLCSVFTILILSILLINLCFPLNHVSASVFSIAVPSVPFDLSPLLKSYDQLSDDQQKIADAIAGSYGTSYSGWAGYSYSGSWTDAAHDLADQITKFGSQIFDSLGNLGEYIVDPLGSASRAVVDALGGAVAYAAEQSSSFSDWWSDNIYDVDGGGGAGKSFAVDGSPSGSLELNQGFMNLVGPGIGLYDWQFQTKPFTTSVSWNQRTMSAVQRTQWNSYYNQFSIPVRINSAYTNNSDIVLDLSSVSEYCNLFFNTSYNTVKLYDSNGNDYYNINLRVPDLVFNSQNNIVLFSGEAWFMSVQKSWNLGNYNTYVDGIKAFYNSAYYKIANNDSSYGFVFLEDFVKHVYVGANWASRQEIFNIDDLNFDDTYERTSIDNPTIPFAIDIAKLITTLIDKLAGTQDAVDGVSIKDAVIGATIDKATGDTITTAQTERIAVQVQYPSSGIVVPDGLFSNLGKYITYLYQQTQPLILYTRDLITALTFDGTGLSWIFFGAVSVGLIGGVICKFLL